jgi:hypothetical protein
MEALKKISIKLSVLIAPKLYTRVSDLYPKEGQEAPKSYPGESIQLFEKKSN